MQDNIAVLINWFTPCILRVGKHLFVEYEIYNIIKFLSLLESSHQLDLWGSFILLLLSFDETIKSDWNTSILALLSASNLNFLRSLQAIWCVTAPGASFRPWIRTIVYKNHNVTQHSLRLEFFTQIMQLEGLHNDLDSV